MVRKTLAVLTVIPMLFVFYSCGLNNDKNQTAPSYSFTQKATLVHNYFKEKLPEHKFKNEPVEKYRDGVSYTLSVTCTLKEFGRYVKKLQKAGFDLNVVEAETYFSANTDDGYFVEATYVGDMFTVFVNKI